MALWYPGERRAIGVITRLQNKGLIIFTVDQYAKEFYQDGWKRPPAWNRNSRKMLQRIGQKLEGSKWGLVRISGIGRGNVGRYKSQGYWPDLQIKKGRQ